MADRKPLVLISGQMQELSGSDTIPASSISGLPGGGGMAWTEVTGTSQSMAVDNGYIANNAAMVTLALPTTAAVGKIVAVTGKGAGGWKISQAAGQQIHFGDLSSVAGTGGYLASTNLRDCAELICVVANNEWQVRSAIGNMVLNQ